MYSNRVTSVVGPATSSGYVTGDWEIQKGMLVCTVKRRSDADMPAVGTVTQSNIESLDDRQLTMKGPRNTTRYERAK